MNTLNSWGKNNVPTSFIEFLVNVPGFTTLSNDDLEMLDKIMVINHYPDSHKFNSDNNIFLIIDGHVAERYQQDSGVMQLNHKHPGELFGLFSIIDNNKTKATCTATGSVRAASLPRSAFELLFNSNLPLGHHFRRIVSQMHDSDTNNFGRDATPHDEQQTYNFLHINARFAQPGHVYTG